MDIDRILKRFVEVARSLPLTFGSLHGKRRPPIDELKSLLKEIEDGTVENDPGRAERLTGSGIPTEPEWPHEAPSEKPLTKLMKGFGKAEDK